MIAARQVVRPRMRFGIAQCSPVSRLIPLASRTVSTVSYQPTPKRRPWLRRLIYFGVFSWLGAQAVKYGIFHMDEEQQIAQLEVVQDPGFVESEVYGNFTEEELEQRLTSGLLSGSGKLRQICARHGWSASERPWTDPFQQVPARSAQSRKADPPLLTDRFHRKSSPFATGCGQ
ncbi:uncharacterized protein DSM5745_07793 [Aspergillus mulundensis]|uniref:Uncharacterized protein n=1 Tax=Aspergillus mulundensis TaxID=1810919 RepID=A0A3D8RFH6_9EURO|nr:hypothetical protein DSM5745_07793 [Aspergillus mulundensis]RDW72621.1 hypothetical protein DSM5745_07793 [Aspergillus mulundensis]